MGDTNHKRQQRFSSVAVPRSPERTGSEESGGGEVRGAVHSEVRGDKHENEKKRKRGTNRRPLDRKRGFVGLKPLGPRRFIGLAATWSNDTRAS
jgi:hypothetical protein